MSEPQVRHDLGTVFVDVGKVSGKRFHYRKGPERSTFESTCLGDALKREARSGDLNLMREYVATLNALPEWRRFGGADFFPTLKGISLKEWHMDFRLGISCVRSR